MTFTEPVFNYSAAFDFIWEEVAIPIAYRDDWQTAEKIMTEEAERISVSADARAALDQMTEQYPVARPEVEPRVFIRATDNYLELAARFVGQVRQARWSNDAYTRRVLERLKLAGIAVASTTYDVTVRPQPTPPLNQDTVVVPESG